MASNDEALQPGRVGLRQNHPALCAVHIEHSRAPRPRASLHGQHQLAPAFRAARHVSRKGLSDVLPPITASLRVPCRRTDALSTFGLSRVHATGP